MGDQEATVRDAPGAARTPTTDDEHLARGAAVGRYVVLDMLGEGGMGVVYTAYDPELDRKVAIKLLQANVAREGSQSGGQEWLLREAQAMARVSHPNVIAVYDVGTLPGDRVFVAMELVDGVTLRAWLSHHRTWREKVTVLRAAGAGLAAAHEAGLVHRDFKPDNMLVARDGRVRVLDFGLARACVPTFDEIEAELRSGRRRLDEQLTATGSVVGTPAYMAPEQFDGQPADARTDQYAFGVTLYEALYGARPFGKGAFLDPKDRPKPPEPPDAGVPARIRRCVLRAIAIDPAARFASMTDLLAELAIDPARSRRRVALGGAALVIICGTGAGLYATGAHRQLCKSEDRKLAGVWDTPAKQQLHDAFLATKHPHAAAAYAAVERVVDRYAQTWTATAVESCEATRIHGDQTEADMALRQDCLDERLEDLRALLKALGKADGAVVEHAQSAVSQLQPLDVCSNLPQLRAPNRPTPEILAARPEAMRMLAAARAALWLGNVGGAINAATTMIDNARKVHDDAGEASALLVRATAESAAADFDDSSKDLDDCAVAAMRSRRDDLLAHAVLTSAMIASQAGKLEAARVWLQIGIAAATRLPNDRAAQYQRYHTEGLILSRSMNQHAAIAPYEKALAIAREIDENSPLVGQVEQDLGLALVVALDYKAAKVHLQHALEIVERTEGPDATDVALMVGSLGMAYAHDDVPRAKELFARGIAIREKALGKNSPALVPPLNNLADLLNKHGDPAGALPYAERARELAKPLGVNNPVYQTTDTTYAEVLYALGRTREAFGEIDAILEVEERTHSPALGATLAVRAGLELDATHAAEAAAFAQRAIAKIEATDGSDSPILWHPLATLGRAKLALGKPDEARTHLERALALAQTGQARDDETAPIRAALASLPAAAPK